MKNLWRVLAIAVNFLCTGAGIMQAGDDAPPDWATQAVGVKVPAYDAKVPGVYLLREQYVEIDANGHSLTTFRSVYKVLTREGRQGAIESMLYLAKTDKMRTVKGWMLGPSGEPLKLSKEQEFDRSYVSYDLYDDLRNKGVDGRTKADPGSIFVFEAVAEGRVLFNQVDWYFQLRRDPVLLGRLIVTLPNEWRTESTTFNHQAIEASPAGLTYTWVVHDLPFVQAEPASPNLSSLVPRVAVSFFPPKGAAMASQLITSWKDVSNWMTTVSSTQAEPTDEVTTKARELTAQSQTEADRIRAIARYVQGTRYVSIQLGLGRGGGYRPRPAAEVLRKEYGDCKDKATLMRALLKAAGISSYLVLVSGNDRSYVHQEWPSPFQFNHVIVAVRTAVEIGTSPAIERPTIGRLLLFDPTAGSTPLGDLPIHEQGGLALVVAGDSGELVRLPFQPAPGSATERQIIATLDQNGTLTAKLSDQLTGQQAAAQRALANGRGPAEVQKVLETWISAGAARAQIDKIGEQDHFAEGRLDLDAEFTVPGYGQIKGNGLMVFKPVMVGRREAVFLTEPKRDEPVLLNPMRFHETVHLKFPENFKVDEMPEAENFETPFGRYSAQCQAKDGELIFTRTLEIQPVSVPVAQYQALREFYEHIMNVERTPVVLARQ